MTSQRVLACTTGALLALAVCASSAAAQAPPAAPKPGNEHGQLKYFVGKWMTEGEAKPGPMGPGGKFSSSDNCELFSGGFYVVCRTNGKGPHGESHEIGILGYDSEKKAYTYYGINNHMGQADVAEGKHEGDTWVYLTGASDAGGGKKMQGRYTISNVTPASYTIKFEMAPEGSSEWTQVMEGKATRVEGKPKPAGDAPKKDTDVPKKSDAKTPGVAPMKPASAAPPVKKP
jgi:hypothetical protein